MPFTNILKWFWRCVNVNLTLQGSHLNLFAWSPCKRYYSLPYNIVYTLSIYCHHKGSFPRNTKMFSEAKLTQRKDVGRHSVQLLICNVTTILLNYFFLTLPRRRQFMSTKVLFKKTDNVNVNTTNRSTLWHHWENVFVFAG